MARWMRRVKRMPDERAMLNLGCGWITHRAWNNLDFGPYARLRRRPILTAILRILRILTDARRDKLAAVDPDIVAWDLRRGVPWPDGTFDVVYHSNLIEHLDRTSAEDLILECHRVLKDGGILRVVTPDLEILTERYLESARVFDWDDPVSLQRHSSAVRSLLEQMVRGEGSSSRAPKGLPRKIERFLQGDAAATGEKHLWAYDRFSLTRLLQKAGFQRISIAAPQESRITGWTGFNLDVDGSGRVRHPDCVYVEAEK